MYEITPSISGQDAKQLMSKYGSPLFVYNADTIVQKAKMVKEAAKNFHISYAMKANSNRQILKILQKSQINCVDVVSPGQIHKALKNGYKPNQILYTQNFISPEEIDFALEAGVILNIGALDTLINFREKLNGKQIFIRINPDLGAGQNYNVITGGPKSKFGIYSTQVEEFIKIAKENNIKIIGLHQHIGSNLKAKDKQVFLSATQFIFKISQKFPDLQNINIGGGIGIKYKQEEELLNINNLYRQVEEMNSKYEKLFNKKIKIWIEPGRFLVGDCGVLLCRITAKKETPQKKFYGTDTGFNHLIRPALYGSHHEIRNVSNPERKKEKVTVCGNICESTDNLGNDIELGGQVGDILQIGNAGAYAFSMSSNYNERCKPAEILIEKGKDRVIRRKQTFEDLEQQI